MARIATTYKDLRLVNEDEGVSVDVPKEHILAVLMLINEFDDRAIVGEYSRSEERHCEAYMGMVDAVAELLGFERDGSGLPFLQLEYENETEFFED